MNRRILLAVMLASAVSLAAFSAFAQTADKGHENHAAKEGTVTMEGEVLDLYCFMKHPADGQGLEHAKCATSCIKKGLPIGFKVGDDVYLIVGREHESAAEMVSALAGLKSRLTGTVVTHHGMKAIEIESIEKL